jgi:hypothetical protein
LVGKIASFLKNPSASRGECARCCGSNFIRSFLESVSPEYTRSEGIVQGHGIIFDIRKKGVSMIKRFFYSGILVSLLVTFIGVTFSQECFRCPDKKLTDLSAPQDFRIDVSSFRCDGGVITNGDLIRDVKRKCGEPLRETCPDCDPYRVLVYQFKQSPYIYYLSFMFERLQRIQSVRCDGENPDCR